MSPEIDFLNTYPVCGHEPREHARVVLPPMPRGCAVRSDSNRTPIRAAAPADGMLSYRWRVELLVR